MAEGHRERRQAVYEVLKYNYQWRWWDFYNMVINYQITEARWIIAKKTCAIETGVLYLLKKWKKSIKLAPLPLKAMVYAFA